MARPDERSRKITWRDPSLGAGALARMSGLEYLQSMASGKLPAPPSIITIPISTGVRAA